MNDQIHQRCYVSVNARTIIDMIHSNGRTHFSDQSFEQIKEKYPDVQEMNVREAHHAIEQCFIDIVPDPISKERFMKSLEILPPEDWERHGTTESFKMCEYIYGCVTTIYVRVGREYYSFHDRATLTHDDIVRKVKEGTCHA